MNIYYNLQDFAELLIRQIEMICPYWIGGLVLGSLASTFWGGKVESLALKISCGESDFLKIFSASLLGVLSPITMHGMVPLIGELGAKKVPQHILFAFILSSILLNPALFIFSFALGAPIALMRLMISIAAGTLGGILCKHLLNNKKILDFSSWETGIVSIGCRNSRLVSFLKSLKKTAGKTGVNLAIGIVLTALFDKFFPRSIFYSIFSGNKGLGVLLAASMGVPIYFCGGGTIPLIGEWIKEGMSIGSAAAFMITGPATKFNNLSAVKNVTSSKGFVLYMFFSLMFAIFVGLLIDQLMGII